MPIDEELPVTEVACENDTAPCPECGRPKTQPCKTCITEAKVHNNNMQCNYSLLLMICDQYRLDILSYKVTNFDTVKTSVLYIH